jgi:SAM-dependent methyltransferase
LSELMDERCSYDDLRACLEDIARINRLTFAYRPTLSWLDGVLSQRPKSAGPLRVMDVGCGFGDMLRRIDAWARRRGIDVVLTGVDRNSDAIRAAKAATPDSCKVEWKVADALSEQAVGDIDIVVCSLLAHHLQEDEIVRLLQWMETTARCGWFINDLHRQPVPYHALRLWTRFMKWHRFVRHDGPVSIRRSFVMDDWRRLCGAAGLAERSVCIREYRPARLCVGRMK